MTGRVLNANVVDKRHRMAASRESERPASRPEGRRPVRVLADRCRTLIRNPVAADRRVVDAFLKHRLKAARGHKRCCMPIPAVQRQSRSGLGLIDGGTPGSWHAAQFPGHDRCRGVRSAWLHSNCGQRKGFPGDQDRRTDAAIDLLRSQVTARPATAKDSALATRFSIPALPLTGLGRGAERQRSRTQSSG